MPAKAAAASFPPSWRPPSHEDSAEAAKAQWRRVADQLRPKLSKLAAFMDEAEDDVLAYMSFPAEHWLKIHSTNGLERLNGEVKRRTEVAGLRTRINGDLRVARRLNPLGLLIRSLFDGRLALRTRATLAVATFAGALFPDRGQTQSGRRSSQAERDFAVVRLRHDRRVRQLRGHR